MPVQPLLSVERELRSGTVVDRPNRFVVRVRFENDPERAYLGDPGALEELLEPGWEILCAPVDDPDRAAAHDAIAVAAGDHYVSVRAALANDLFERAISRDAVPAFSGYAVRSREPRLPEHGRADFLLEGPARDEALVEVKSCTHVDDRVAKFPDRQTERGRRHLGSLEAYVRGGGEAHLVFVVQRPDADHVRPYRSVDPDFAELLSRANDAGVGVHAIATAFDPPNYRLAAAELPVDLSGSD